MYKYAVFQSPYCNGGYPYVSAVNSEEEAESLRGTCESVLGVYKTEEAALEVAEYYSRLRDAELA